MVENDITTFKETTKYKDMAAMDQTGRTRDKKSLDNKDLSEGYSTADDLPLSHYSKSKALLVGNSTGDDVPLSQYPKSTGITNIKSTEMKIKTENKNRTIKQLKKEARILQKEN